MRSVAVLLLVALTQSWRPFPARGPVVPPGSPSWLTAAMAQDLSARLGEVADVFHRAPVLASPQGWVMFPKRQVPFTGRSWAEPAAKDRKWIVAGELKLWASTFEADGRTVYDTGSAFVVNISANNLNCVFNNAASLGADADGTMYLEPEAPSAKEHGFPVYSQCVLITHRTQPLYVPVSQARLLAFRIADVEKRLAHARAAGMGETLAPAEGLLAAMRKQLADMDERARTAPAWAMGAESLEPLVAERTPGARRVVEANPAFFDQARPGDIQVLTLFDGCVVDTCVSYPMVEKVKAQLDWPALAAIVR
jgi:hypothetical protein